MRRSLHQRELQQWKHRLSSVCSIVRSSKGNRLQPSERITTGLKPNCTKSTKPYWTAGCEKNPLLVGFKLNVLISLETDA